MVRDLPYHLPVKGASRVSVYVFPLWPFRDQFLAFPMV
jgi:hypothetical protein